MAAVLNVTGASDIFTQDLEDLPLVTQAPTNFRETEKVSHTDTPATAPHTETPEQEAARLFPDDPDSPIVAPEHSDAVLLAKALGLLDSRVRAEAVRKKLWDQSCAPTPYRAMPPREQLLALLGSLGAK